jgi:hypothetical protein
MGTPSKPMPLNFIRQLIGHRIGQPRPIRKPVVLGIQIHVFLSVIKEQLSQPSTHGSHLYLLTSVGIT